MSNIVDRGEKKMSEVITNITTVEDYLKLLWLNNNGETPTEQLFFTDKERIYNIDLNTRTIEAPVTLSLQQDHNSRNIYFLVDRMFGSVDLATKTCVIQYINAQNEYRIYPVPFYDLTTFGKENYIQTQLTNQQYEKGKYYIKNTDGAFVISNEDYDVQQIYYTYINSPKILFPWLIGGDTTPLEGIIKYSIRFYSVDYNNNRIDYNLNTQPASSVILPTINTEQLGNEYNGIEPTELDKIYDKLISLENNYYDKEMHWIEF